MGNTSKGRLVLRRVGYSLAALLLLLMLLAIAGATYEQVTMARAVRRYPMSGRLVDVGGYRLHIYCVGDETPTVVMTGSFKGNVRDWNLVQPEVAKIARACSFDRAGLGWSEPSPLPRTSKRVAEEMHALLSNAGINPPYVFVGQAEAGLDMRMFANLYADEVVGMVLVDSKHPGEWARVAPRYAKRVFFPDYRIHRLTAPIGIPRLLGKCPEAPPTCGRYLATLLTELASYGQSTRQVHETKGLGKMPLVVITHDPQTFMYAEGEVKEQEYMRDQQDLARLSTNSTLVVAKGARREISIDRPQVVVDAIKKVIEDSKCAPSK